MFYIGEIRSFLQKKVNRFIAGLSCSSIGQAHLLLFLLRNYKEGETERCGRERERERVWVCVYVCV